MKLESTNEHIERLIVRYFSGEALPEEAIELEEWIDKSPANKKYFEDFRFVSNHTGPAKRYVSVDTSKAWENVSRQMKPLKKPDAEAVKVQFPVYRKRWFNIAASIVILIGLSVIFILNNPKNEKLLTSVALVSNDSIIHRELSPTIKISVNRKSNVAYLSDRAGKKNEIKITGEAFIEVNHSIDTMLLVRADETFIRDIGTSFNVKAYPENNIVEVFVENGKVAFYTKEHKGIIVNAGETGVYDKTSKIFNIVTYSDPNVIAYKTRNLVFRNSSLQEVVKILNDVYPDKVILDNQNLADYKISVTFNNEPLDSITEIIGETLGIQVRKDSTGFVLYDNE